MSMSMVSRASPGAAARRRPRSRDEAKRETRDALIRAGMALFGEEGLDGPSLDAICARAGRTRGAFYVHFRDRDDFLQAVMEHVGVAFLDTVLAPGRGGVGLEATVRRFLESVATGAYPLTRPGGVRPHQLLDACARSPAIRDRYVALVMDSVGRVREVVKAGQGTGALRADVDPEQVAGVLLAAVIGAQTMLELRVPMDFARAAETVLALLRK